MPIDFDPNADEYNSEQKTGDFALLPECELPCLCLAAKIVDNKFEVGCTNLELEVSITDGQYKGRRFWKRIALVHTDSDKQTKGRRSYAITAKAFGVGGTRDEADFIQREAMVSIGVLPEKDGNKAKNYVKWFNPLSKSVAAVLPPSTSKMPARKSASFLDD